MPRKVDFYPHLRQTQPVILTCWTFITNGTQHVTFMVKHLALASFCKRRFSGGVAGNFDVAVFADINL